VANEIINDNWQCFSVIMARHANSVGNGANGAGKRLIANGNNVVMAMA